MKIICWNSLSPKEQTQALSRSPLVNDNAIEKQVMDIINKVIDNGDDAIKHFNQQFDKAYTPTLKVTESQIKQAEANVSSDIKQSILAAIANIRLFHQAQKFQPISIETQEGVKCEYCSEPIEKVGLYIPGGTAPLISTVLMLAIPAAIADCKQRILISPPPINDAILFAAKACNITQIYQAGGAQAIAALAFGTPSIPQVDKIFGPGNTYVTEAKRIVSQDNRISVSIDMPAGPSEVLVIADKYANPTFIAADLLSQAEHGPDSQVLLVTDDKMLAENVLTQIDAQLLSLPRIDIAKTALKYSRIIITEDIQQAALVSNRYGPEHLIIQTQFPRQVLSFISGAGSVFLGQYTPESVGDYASGTNHVLPTYGYSRSVSSLSLADFCRRYTVQELTSKGLSNIADTVMTLAEAEQLSAHKYAVKLRVDEISGSKDCS